MTDTAWNDTCPAYSEVMEDDAILAEALPTTAGGVLICVASAGDNAFHAALRDVERVHAVDISPAQIELCRTKEAALRELEWPELAELTGVLDALPERRRELLERLPEGTVPDALRQAETSERLARHGLNACGQLSAFVAPLRDGLRATVGGENVDRLLCEERPEERRRLWERSFATEAVVDFFATALNEDTIGDSFIPAQAFERMAEKPFHRFYLRVLEQRLVALDPRENFFLHRLWRGGYPSPEAVPDYLRRELHPRVRAGLGRVAWHTADLLTFLREQPAASAQAFNLSNILDWSGDAHYAELWTEVDRVAAPGARVFLRSFLEGRPLPADVAGRWQLAPAETRARWAERDRVGYYSRYEAWERAG